MEQDREPRNRTVCVCETDFCKGIVSSMNFDEIIEICRQKGKLNTCIVPCTNVNSKWIRDLKVKPKTIKLLD